MLFPTPWICGKKRSKVCEDFNPTEGKTLAVSNLTAVFVATAALLLCAKYLTGSIRASARSCLNHLLIVSRLTALRGEITLTKYLSY